MSKLRFAGEAQRELFTRCMRCFGKLDEPGHVWRRGTLWVCDSPCHQKAAEANLGKKQRAERMGER